MSEDKDVLGRLDALMRKPGGVAAPTTGDGTGGIPVLTDFVEVPQEAQPPADPKDEVAARVLETVESRLASEIERRVAERIAPSLKEAVRQAVAELREELGRLVNEAVEGFGEFHGTRYFT